MSVDEPETTFAKAMAELQAKQESNAAVLGIGSTDRWDADLDRGMIVFSGPKARVVVRAAVQVIGTFNTDDQSFLWGWDHPSVPAAVAAHARLCRDFGQRHALSEFTRRKIACAELDAWRFTAVGLHLARATGAYRGPAGRTNVFMTFHDVSLSKG